MSMTQLRRDPFGRQTLMRMTEERSGRGPCSFCGKPDSKYRYAWWSDQNHISVLRRLWSTIFCSVGCWRSYND